LDPKWFVVEEEEKSTAFNTGCCEKTTVVWVVERRSRVVNGMEGGVDLKREGGGIWGPGRKKTVRYCI
jgi:hypothetical protein